MKLNITLLLLSLLLSSNPENKFSESKNSEPFDKSKEFQIVTIKKSNEYPSSDNGKSVCEKWNLGHAQIQRIIKDAQSISGPEWHHSFGHYPCEIEGKLSQGENEFTYSINSGSWLTVSSSDTTLMFGSFNKNYNKYFLDSAWLEEDMDE
ncbi:hypothetical protein KMW28_10280 [Flammeovirga yaeyamensis]|uniref:Uncharacterized protein n=1 Tax=Flammeovirga yaeyamensis TaxID=367791 RepID=A0AAX1MXV0_9BACT|nr:hypothetical protein [Flammeovirga yaeyamensis]MBB3696460.1 hypothetical protein [Flammeovirga yaeyamensis]NMF35138.1 hypothetical protein [Flammeovirga yaeyamensis]QWG00042.1 hypothetical protein KMW28_10280 [Flammeovirga yaeyamensis]